MKGSATGRMDGSGLETTKSTADGGPGKQRAARPGRGARCKREKGGRQRLRVVGIRCIRRADRLRHTASSTKVQAEDAIEEDDEDNPSMNDVNLIIADGRY